jgi:uncharacterized protein YqkB
MALSVWPQLEYMQMYRYVFIDHELMHKYNNSISTIRLQSSFLIS